MIIQSTRSELVPSRSNQSHEKRQLLDLIKKELLYIWETGHKKSIRWCLGNLIVHQIIKDEVMKRLISAYIVPIGSDIDAGFGNEKYEQWRNK